MKIKEFQFKNATKLKYEFYSSIKTDSAEKGNCNIVLSYSKRNLFMLVGYMN